MIASSTLTTSLTTHDSLDLWLDKLGKCESSNRSSIKVMDSNGKYSYGLLQFQESTFINQTLKHGLLPQSEKKEIMNWVYDPDYQKLLAKKMIQAKYSNWRHWTNCATKIGLPPKQ